MSTAPQVRHRPDPERVVEPARVALVDLLDRLLSGGVVIAGDVVLSIADVDLVRISLRALVMSVGEAADQLAPSDTGNYVDSA